MKCTENPSRGADSYLVLSSVSRWARSLHCHLCSSQAVPSVLGSGAVVTGYAFRRVHHRRAYLWGTVFRQWLCPLLPPALTAPRRWGSREAMVASCITAQFPSSLGSSGEDRAWPGLAGGSCRRRRGLWLQPAWRGTGGRRGGQGSQSGVGALGAAAEREGAGCGRHGEFLFAFPGAEGWVRQVQYGGLSCRPAVSCGFHGN